MERRPEAMSDKIIRFDDAVFESELDALVRVKVERTINAMPDAEADEIANAAGYERETDRKAFCAGRCGRTLAAKAGKLSLKAPELKGALFGSAVIERCRRRESSVEEALMEMCLAGVSTRGVDGTGRLLWGERMPSRTLSDKLKKIYKEIDGWRKRPLESEYPYVFVDGVWRKRSWGGHVENAGVLVAIGVGTEGRREAIAVDEGMREDAAGRERFFRSMIERGLRGVGPVVGDRCAGLVSTVNSMPPNAEYQRCIVRFMRDVPSKTPPGHREWAASWRPSSRRKTANPPWPRQGRSRAKWRNASSRRPRTACAGASARPPPASCRGSPRTMGSSRARTTWSSD